MSKYYRSWNEAEREAPIFSFDNLPLMYRQYQFKHFEGDLLTLIESMGLPTKQEEAVKSYVRRELWDFVHTGYVISDEMDNEMSQNPSAGQIGPSKKRK